MTERINGEGQTEKEIVANYDPCDLDRIGCPWHGIQQKSADCQHGPGEQDPRSGFTLNGSGFVDDAANEKTDDTA